MAKIAISYCRIQPRFYRRPTRIVAVALFVNAMIIPHANAVQVNTTWTGGTGNWSDAASWSGGVVPNNSAAETYLSLIDNSNTAVDSHVILAQATTIDGLTVDLGDHLTIVNSSLAIASSGFVHNHGLIVLDSSQLTLLTGTTTTLDGGGTFRMTDSTASQIFGNGTLHNELGHTIDGSGKLTSAGNAGVRINNKGTLDANIAGEALLLKIMAPLSSQNTGLLRASNGGILDFRAPTSTSNFDNTGGTIVALADSRVLLNGRIRGGNLNAEAGGRITISGGVDFDFAMELNNAAGALVEIPDVDGNIIGDAASLTFDGSGTYNNNGSILLSSAFGHSVSLAIRGDVVLQGTGFLQLSNTALNVVGNRASSEGTLTNAIGHTIEGAGQLGNDQIGLINEGMVAANLPGGDLVINPGHLGSLLNEFVTSGTVTVAPSSCILMGPNDTFQQTGGATVVDGVLETNGGMVQVLGGGLSGTGTVVSPVQNGGVVEPGGSIGKLTITGDYTQIAGGTLNVEIGGLSAETEHDQLMISGTATLAGTLSAELVNNFVPSLDDTFDILTAGSVTGGFNATSLPTLDSGLAWHVAYLPDLVRISVVSMTGLPGDVNGDGGVNAADYVVWRNGLGTVYTEQDYTDWRAHFGQMSASARSLIAAPEPDAWLMALATSVLVCGSMKSWRRIRKQQ